MEWRFLGGLLGWEVGGWGIYDDAGFWVIDDVGVCPAEED